MPPASGVPHEAEQSAYRRPRPKWRSAGYPHRGGDDLPDIGSGSDIAQAVGTVGAFGAGLTLFRRDRLAGHSAQLSNIYLDLTANGRMPWQETEARALDCWSRTITKERKAHLSRSLESQEEITN